MNLTREEFEMVYEDRERVVSPYSQIAAIRLHDRLGRLQNLTKEVARFSGQEGKEVREQ